ncbi:nitroreductase family protein [uncultured Clostridium sp.]|uniref:nitroreductase family protein n=1 Tax=uncultured Clostridium sp. TaxID=59620 RepID=UPI0025FF4074|nr:nitroreductase family protein [uncultured Clostridium sp.]
MEFQTLIEKRRSVRSYDGEKKVTEEQIKECVNAAIQAPSWKNSQTARYYCILDDEMREKFSNECLPEFNAKNSKGAALVVTTFVANRAGFNKNTGEPDNECGNGWGYYDLGLHNENFILKAKDLGLDTLIMGIRDGEKIRTILNVPENETVVSVIAVGYATAEASKPKRKECEDILKFI